MSAHLHAEEIVELARALWGAPNKERSTRDDVRFGAHGSKSVNRKTGQWFDHETGKGGGYASLFEEVNGHPPQNGHDSGITATYDYCDATGALLFQVARKIPKDFRQRRPDGSGGWIWNLQGVERVPYRLPELLAAPITTAVYIAEGEKDVDALRDRLLIATCNPGGARKWATKYNEHLRGRDVVILPDNDEDGEAHAADVATKLCGVARSIRIVRLPGLPLKGDVSDWFAAGGTADQLEELAAKAPEWTGRSKAGEEPPGSSGLGKSGTSIDGEPWPSPFDFLSEDSLTGTPELRPDHLPEPIAAFVFDTAARMGADPAAVALAALVSLASVASDDWRIQPKQFDTEWTEAPRIWGAIVGDPSIRKTPLLKACTSPIDRLEAEARTRHGEATTKHKAEMAAWKKANGEADVEPKAPILDRFMAESVTIEALSEVLRDDAQARQRAPSKKVLVRQDELGELLANFDRYRSGGAGGGDRGAFLRLYNGGRYTIDRIIRGSFSVSNWSACLLGGIQPEPIQRIASQMVDDGLLQRFCFCVAERQGHEEDRAPDVKAITRYRALFPALAAARPSQAPAGRSLPPIVFHADAHKHRLDILALAEAAAAMPDGSGRLKSALGKWPGLFPRLALIFHLIGVADARAAERPEPLPLVVSEDTSRRVAAYMRDVLLPHLLRAENLMFATAQTTHAEWVAGYILSQEVSVLSLRDIVQAYRSLRAPERRDELLAMLQGLEAFGWLRPLPAPASSHHPTRWAVNPAVHTQFATRAAEEKAAREETKRRIAITVAQMRPGKHA